MNKLSNELALAFGLDFENYEFSVIINSELFWNLTKSEIMTIIKLDECKSVVLDPRDKERRWIGREEKGRRA